MNIAAHLIRAGRAFAGRPAIASGSTALLPYGALADRVCRLAHALRHRFALRKGDRVALVLGNCPEYLEILYACWHAGLVAVPVNARLHPTELAYILDDCTAGLCFASETLIGGLEASAGGKLRFVVEVGGEDYRRMLASEPLPLVDCTPDDLAWLFYTSGRTGRP